MEPPNDLLKTVFAEKAFVFHHFLRRTPISRRICRRGRRNHSRASVKTGLDKLATIRKDGES